MTHFYTAGECDHRHDQEMKKHALEAAHAEVTRTYQELLKAAQSRDFYEHLRASERHAAAQQRYIKAKEQVER